MQPASNWINYEERLNRVTAYIYAHLDDDLDLRSRACFTVSKPFKIEAPLKRITIAGGEYSVLLHKGAYDGLAAAYQWFFGTWLLQSGRELRDAPAFEEYLNTPMNAGPSELLTEIHLPLV